MVYSGGMSDFGDYIVFVDESGDQSMEKVNQQYPVFVLSFCIFSKQHYSRFVVPKVFDFKMKYFGSAVPVLHEHEMRKAKGDFSILQDPAVRSDFYTDLNSIMVDSEYQIVSSIIDKNHYDRLPYHTNIYSLSALYGLERVLREMEERGQSGKRIPVIFESRGRVEDANLMQAIEGICKSTPGAEEMFDVQCISKLCNCIGLQFSDMVARPIGTHHLHPDQKNRAWDMLEPKIRRSWDGKIYGYGLKVYP